MGMLASTIANCAMGRDPDSRAFTASDFMPGQSSQTDEGQTPEQMREFILAFRAAREKAAQS